MDEIYGLQPSFKPALCVTRVFSIFERIGLGGGGKVKAIYHRMNALAEMQEFEPVLLNLDHSPKQKLNFAELQGNGTISPRVRHLTVPEACHEAALIAGAKPFDTFPSFDHHEPKGQKVIFSHTGKTVMVDKVQETAIGLLTQRVVPHKDGDRVYTLIDGHVHQMVQRKADDTFETTDFVASIPCRWTKTQGRRFIIGKNLITGTICRMPRIYGQNLFEMINWTDSVVFFDGVTSAYLAAVNKGQRALFLHADHRGPGGEIVPRSKYLIENFKGEAIITSTNVHKKQIEMDVTPSAKVHVIPHFCQSTQTPPKERKHLVTVSRLELVGKPIHQCIDAFCRIKDSAPDIDYVIYGLGTGQAALEEQIARLGCGDRVRLAGYTSEPLAVFQGALASVYPTMTEGFGLSILEALANGCPVISYDVNYGPREMIRPGENGELVPPGDIDAIAAAMKRVLLKPVQYQRKTGIGLERYTRKTYLKNYRNLISMLAAGGAERSNL